MSKLSTDLTAGVLHPRENLWIAGNLGSVNAEIITNADGCSSVAIDLRGTFSLTVELAGTVDGTNWTPIPVKPLNTASKLYVPSIVGTTAGVWVGSCGPYRKIRARVTAYTSGSATTYLCADTAILDQSLDGLITSSLGTATGTSAAAVTLTLASPGTGLRHYLTFIRIERHATALLTAGTTPVIITTTNIPGSLAFSIPADAAAQGAVYSFSEGFPNPIATVAQATATTIVAPTTTATIWRITAGFYVAP